MKTQVPRRIIYLSSQAKGIAMTDEQDSELIQDFLTEAREKVEQLGPLFLRLEKDPKDSEAVREVFRALHTIKGTSGFFGFAGLEKLAHAGESLLVALRDEGLPVSQNIIDLLLQCNDVIEKMLDAVERTHSDRGIEYEELARKLLKAREAAAGSTADEPPTPAPPESKAEPLVSAVPEPSVPPGARDATATEDGDATGRGRVAHDIRDHTIRVPVGLVEDLMNQVGELVLARNQVLQHVRTKDMEGLERASQELNQVTSRLQENMMKTRLQPVGSVFNKFMRIVRDLSRTQRKQVRLEISGESTEVDRTLIEAIVDPLTHIIRNAVDHGIEAPQDREAAGKSPSGTIRLWAHHEGEHVIVSVKDDGRGIDPNRVRAKALERGLISSAEAARMSSRQIINLIFLPGFSTAEQVTNLSGRGVGMDVVKTELEKVNGMIEIESAVGKGSTFRLEIPLTLAIFPALIVSVGGHLLAIPQVNTVEVVRMEEQQAAGTLQHLGGASLVLFRSEWIPVVDLRTLLHLSSASASEETSPFLVVARSGTQQVALVVDDVIDTEEIVVKPLVRQLRKIGCYSGSSILGNGRVTLIVDVAGLFRLADIDKRDVPEHVMPSVTTDRHQMLLCSIGSVKAAIYLALVASIVQIERHEVQRIANQEVVAHEGQLLPLVRANEFINASSDQAGDWYHIVVFKYASHSVGLITEWVVDSIDYDGPVQHDAVSADCVMGSLLVQGTAVPLLNLYQIVEHRYPQWRGQMTELASTVAADKRSVLLVDDSPFLLNVVREYLTSAGFTVRTAINGEQALTLFDANHFDCIVTDIEMPVMDGIELTSQVRARKRHADIPILALTSATSEVIRQKAMAAGVNDYLIKFDRDVLLTAIRSALATGSVNGIQTGGRHVG